MTPSRESTISHCVTSTKLLTNTIHIDVNLLDSHHRASGAPKPTVAPLKPSELPGLHRRVPAEK